MNANIKRITVTVVLIFLISCSSNVEKDGTKSKTTTTNDDSIYKDWQTGIGENVKFKFPKNWRLSIQNKAKGITRFGLTDDTDTSNDVFFPVEIWEFSSSMGSYKDFSTFVPNDYFKRSSDGEYANLLSSDTTKFKNLEAITFNYLKDKHPVQITTVNGINKYYLLINYIHESTIKQATNIFNSVSIKSN